MCDDIDMLGQTTIVLKTDGEPSVIQVQNAITFRRVRNTFCQNPPAYNPQAIGSDARAILEVMGQVRAMKIGLEQRINNKMNTEWRIME